MKFSALALSLVLGGGSAAEFFSSSDAAFRDYLANFDKAYSELEIAVRYKLWSGRVEEVNSFNAEGKVRVACNVESLLRSAGSEFLPASSPRNPSPAG